MKSDLTRARSLDLEPAAAEPVDRGNGGSNGMLSWRPLWLKWAQHLRRLGMSELAASLLEGVGALNVMNAQLIYMSQPILGLIVADEDLSILAQTLEEPERVRAFASLIREEGAL